MQTSLGNFRNEEPEAVDNQEDRSHGVHEGAGGGGPMKADMGGRGGAKKGGLSKAPKEAPNLLEPHG